jgi:hypothetical protein
MSGYSLFIGSTAVVFKQMISNGPVFGLFQACQVPDIILNYFFKNTENYQIGFLEKETRRYSPNIIFHDHF